MTTTRSGPLTVDADDPRAVAALDAERRLFDFYGLKAETHHVRLPDVDLRVRVSAFGSGRPVVVVPGNTGDGFPLAPLVAELPECRVILINRPGGGLSDGMDHRRVDFRELAVKTLTSVLDYFRLDQVPVIAHSIGGHGSLWFARDRPERVSALMLLGVPGNLMDTTPPLALRLLTVPVLSSLLFEAAKPRSANRALKGLSFMGHSPETVASLPEAMADCYVRFQDLPHYKISSLTLMRRVNRLLGSRPGIRIGPTQLAGIRHPTLFLWGTNDPWGSIETGRRICEAMPDAEFHAVAGGGHLPWLDEPAECGRLIRDFLSDH
ncbi:alpha/beta fold hydrolase [Streptomyces violaceusniger]|uniref:Alpha/beta hydrolase n=1 Tax=Streptomyces violaceusniger TaxID=68280 RepID=A0A4D4KLX9_STRVO|nr:alpha/beta hydrolase [Streptomyces violaceusniger]